jgi:hypothetical protein
MLGRDLPTTALSKQCTISLIDFALLVVYIWFGYRVTRIYLVWFPFLCTTTIYSILFPSGSVSAHLSSANNRESGAVSYTATASSNTPQLPASNTEQLPAAISVSAHLSSTIRSSYICCTAAASCHTNSYSVKCITDLLYTCPLTASRKPQLPSARNTYFSSVNLS